MKKITQERKKLIIWLRWTVIILISYLILFGKIETASLSLPQIFILVYILSNFILFFFPKTWFYNPKLFYSLVILDTGIISFGMYLSGKGATDFYLVFFLILIFASMSRSYKLLMIISGIMSILYGILLYTWGLLGSEENISYTLRIPFIFIMAAFYGYLIQTFTKEKQKALAISEDKYRGLFENSNEGIIILRDFPFRIVDINREVERLTGFKKEELFQKDVFNLFRSEERKKVSDFFEEVAKEGEGKTDSLSMTQKDGKEFEVDLSVKRIDLGEETFCQVIFRDLTEQRKLEKKIREGKRNLEAIFDGIQDQLSIQSPDYQILHLNRAVIEIHHTPYEELVGKKCYEAYYQRSLPCEKCPITVTIETKKPASSIMKIIDSDSTLRIFSYPILNEKGDLISIIEYVHDITEEKQLQEQLLRSEKLAGLGILTSGVSHEINNPLTGIMGMAEIALEEKDPSKIKNYLKDILNCSQKIGEIVKGLSSYSKIAKREGQTLVDINEALENSLRMVRMVMKTSPVVIKQFQQVEKIEANMGEIQLAFNHLITNAFQSMNGQGGQLILSTKLLKEMIEVKVIDNGVGIPQKHLNQIFDPFFTTRNFGEGKGLGLNIVYRIMTRYGGSINVESKEGVGSTFLLHFPIGRVQ
jgi:PAS domain S-box-containing protein